MAIRIQFEVTVNGVVVDPCNVALPLSITMGRSGTNSQPDAPTCSFRWLGPDFPGVYGSEVKVYAIVSRDAPAKWTDSGVSWQDPTVSWGYNVAKVPRFTGTVGAMRADKSEGEIKGFDIQCTGMSAQLGMRFIDIQSTPETDFERIQRIATAAGVTITNLGTETVDLIEDHIERNPLSAIHQVCESSGGLFWEDENGDFFYGGLDHRREDPRGVLPCTVIEDGITWDMTDDDIINSVKITYGSNVLARNRQTVTMDDPTSIATYGKREVSIDSLCADITSATILGELILRRNANLYWRNGDAVYLVSEKSTLNEYANAVLWDVSTCVLAPISNDPNVDLGLRPWTIEGWVETYDVNHYIQFALSDRNKFGAAGWRNWQEVSEQSFGFWKQGNWADQLIKGGI